MSYRNHQEIPQRPQAKPRKKTAAELQQTIDKARRCQTLIGNPGWEILRGIMEDAIRNMRNRLLMEDCQWDEVRLIRAQVSWLDKLIATPDISPEKFAQWEQEVAHRLEKEKMRATLGMSPGAPNGAQHEEVQG